MIGLRAQVLSANGTLGVVTAMEVVLGRKSINVGEPARITDLPPLMRCDTAALVDGVKIVTHVVTWKGRRARIMAMLGDGQSCLTMSYLKRHWPETYQAVLILNGHWHSCAVVAYHPPARVLRSAAPCVTPCAGLATSRSPPSRSSHGTPSTAAWPRCYSARRQTSEQARYGMA